MRPSAWWWCLTTSLPDFAGHHGVWWKHQWILGATGWQTFRYVVLPNLGSALLAGGMLAFALSFDEIIVTTFTAGHERTLPLWLLNQLGRPRDVPVTNVVALLVMLVTTVPILGAWWLTRDGEYNAESGK